MKQLTIFFICCGLACLSSCKQKPPESNEYKWGEDAFDPIDHYTPISAVWIKKDENNEWITYKCFNSVDELSEIGSRIGDPEKFEYDPNFTGDYSLVVYYVPPRKPTRIPFSMDDSTKEIITARGRGKELYRLFSEKKEWKDYWSESLFKFPSDIPVDAVWVKERWKLGSKDLPPPTNLSDYELEQIPYKCFNSGDELRTIIHQFENPEVKEPSYGFIGNESMVIWYIPPTEPVRLSFSMDDSTKEVITSKGRSKELYKLFTEKEKRINNPTPDWWTKEKVKELMRSSEEQISTNDFNLPDLEKQEK